MIELPPILVANAPALAAPSAHRPLSRSIYSPRTRTGYATFRLFHGEEPPTLSVKEQVTVALAERIVEWRLPPGERIVEHLVAEEFGISKAPVSEALLVLEHLGLAESGPRRSAVVPAVNEADFQALIQFRKALATVTLPGFFERQRPDDRQTLREYGEELDAISNDDTRAFAFGELMDRSTTVYFALHCGNVHVARALCTLSLQLLRYARLFTQTPQQRRNYLAKWREMLHALEERSPEPFLRICEEFTEMRLADTSAALRALKG